VEVEGKSGLQRSARGWDDQRAEVSQEAVAGAEQPRSLKDLSRSGAQPPCSGGPDIKEARPGCTRRRFPLGPLSISPGQESISCLGHAVTSSGRSPRAAARRTASSKRAPTRPQACPSAKARALAASRWWRASSVSARTSASARAWQSPKG